MIFNYAAFALCFYATVSAGDDTAEAAERCKKWLEE